MRCSKIIGICGGSASGKSLLSKELIKYFNGRSCRILQDSYYYAFDELSLEEKKKVNYDHPDAFDIRLMITHLKKLKQGITISCPVYSYELYTRTGEYNIEPKELIVLDGMYLFHYPELRNLIDIKIFIDVPENIRLKRMIERDIAERGRTEAFAVEQFFRDMKPMHDLYVEIQREWADIILDGTKPQHSLLQEVKMNMEEKNHE